MSGTSASWPALGTTATVVVDGGPGLDAARAAVEAELADIDRACSRFRPDAELVRLNRAAGEPVAISPLLQEAIELALRAARMTDGLVDPTVGAAMDAIGYDRDLIAISPDGPPIDPAPAGRWDAVRLDRELGTVQLPPDVRLDLGATAKAWAADRAAERARAAAGSGVLVSLGGDVAIAGAPPPGGWPVAVADDHAATTAAATVALSTGGLATSSTTVRRWRRGGRPVHHIVDPSTGLPARVVWRTVSVAAASCVDANVAATAAIVRGSDAPAWLRGLGLPARLVAARGTVVTVAGWPAEAVAA